MRFNKTFYVIALTAIAGGALSSCSNELSEPGSGETLSNAINLVKSPEVYAYSGGQTIGYSASTRSADMNANMWKAEGWNCENANKRNELSDEDIAAIKALLSKGTPTYNTLIVPWPNYYVEQIYKGQAPDEAYVPTDINGNEVSGSTITGSNQMDKLVAYNENITNTNYGGYNDPDNNWAWVEVITEDHYEHVNNFNYGNNTNTPGADSCGEVHKGVTLMTNMSLEGIAPDNQFGFHESFGTSHNYNNYIIVEYNGEWYVGFDYEMHKNEAQNANEAKNVERDWNFTDWIVRISPAYLGENPTEYPAPYNPSEGPSDPGTGGPEETPTPDVPAIADVPEHVEVNLSIEERFNYLTSHLSIHVRAVTNVEVFVPIPARYVCEADDLDIVQRHEDDLMVHGGPTTVTYTINGETVTLTVNVEAQGIRVTTSGINENVISYLKERYDDGVTFEVWNYMNIRHSDWIEEEHEYLDLAALKGYMNQSTIKFLDRAPELYVNAFMYETGDAEFHEGHEGVFCDDCTVKPFDENLYDTQETNWFYNSSPYNELYYNAAAE